MMSYNAIKNWKSFLPSELTKNEKGIYCKGCSKKLDTVPDADFYYCEKCKETASGLYLAQLGMFDPLLI